MPRPVRRLDLLGVPVAGIGEDHLGRLGDAGGCELGGPRRPSVRGARSRVRSSSSRRRSRSGLRCGGLGVVALQAPVRRLDDARVGVGGVDLASGAPVACRASADRRSGGRPSSPRAPDRPRRRRSRAARHRVPLRAGDALPAAAWRASAGSAGPARRAARPAGAWRRAATAGALARGELLAAARRRAARRSARPRRASIAAASSRISRAICS